MKLTIYGRKAYGRTDYFIQEPDIAMLFAELRRGAKTVSRQDVAILEQLGFECVMPLTMLVASYTGPDPIPARHYWPVV